MSSLNASDSSNCGFSLLDLLLAVSVTAIMLAVALPSVSGALRTYKLVGSARSIGHQLASARMEAAARSTRARLTANLTDGTYQVDVCTIKGASVCSTFAPEGGTRYLAQGTQFGYGSITVPAGTQTTIAQTPTIIVNSRGIPIDSSGAPSGTSALYLTNGAGEYCAVTLSPSSNVTIWKYISGTWAAQ